MSIKSRIKKLEQSITGSKGKTFYEEWQERTAKYDEIETLFDPILQGDLNACIRYCELMDEEMEDRIYVYRDVFVEHVAREEGIEPDLKEITWMDILHENVKAAYRYLEQKKTDSEVQPPKLIQIPG